MRVTPSVRNQERQPAIEVRRKPDPQPRYESGRYDAKELWVLLMQVALQVVIQHIPRVDHFRRGHAQHRTGPSVSRFGAYSALALHKDEPALHDDWLAAVRGSTTPSRFLNSAPSAGKARRR